MAFCSELYGKDELLKEYIAYTQKYGDELCAMVKKTLVPFVYMGILSDQDKKKWAEEDQQYGTEERFRRVIEEVLESGSLDRFIKFTRALTFKNTHEEITRVFNFFPSLFEVGLVDPLQDKSEVKLIPRNISPGKPVVLCLVTNKEKFDCCKSLLQNPQDGHKSGFIVTEPSSNSDGFDVHVAYSEEKTKPKAPGRKYNLLLAQYDPCPSLIVCITECVLSEEEEATDREHVFLLSSFSQSRCDKTAEVRHVTRLLQLQKNSDQIKKAKDYLSRVEICTRQATRYVGVQGSSVHCPDAANLHYASKISTIPAIAIARVVSEQNNATNPGDFYYFVKEIIKYMV